MSNVKQLAAELEKAAKEEGERLLTKHKKRIELFIRQGGSYYCLYNYSARLSNDGSNLNVNVWVGRKEPLFEDYDLDKSIPIEYLEANDPEQWLKSKKLDEEIKNKENRRKQLKCEVRDLEFDINNQTKLLLSKKEELSKL